MPPYPPDLACPEIAHRRSTASPPDPHGCDGDADGVGCARSVSSTDLGATARPLRDAMPHEAIPSAGVVRGMAIVVEVGEWTCRSWPTGLMLPMVGHSGQGVVSGPRRRSSVGKGIT